MKKIPLTKGKFALVDNEDFEKINKFNWCFSVGYAVRGIRIGKITTPIRMHRFIMGLKKGDKLDVDHKNHNKLDNRKINLRVCTDSQNKMNMPYKKDNKSGFKGVHWHTRSKKWRGAISFNKKKIWIGEFSDKTEAAKAYNKAARKYHGEFCFLNTV